MHKVIGDLYSTSYKLDVSKIETIEDVREIFKLLGISVTKQFIDRNTEVANKFFKEITNV